MKIKGNVFWEREIFKLNNNFLKIKKIIKKIIKIKKHKNIKYARWVISGRLKNKKGKKCKVKIFNK